MRQHHSSAARLRALAFLTSTVLSSGLLCPAAAHAQATPPHQVIDANGVDVASGQMLANTPGVSMADMVFQQGWTGTIGRNALAAYIVDDSGSLIVYMDGKSKVFASNGSGGFVPVDGDGSTLQVLSGFENYIYTSSDGTIYTFNNLVGGVYGGVGMAGIDSHLVTAKEPSGRTLTYHYFISTTQLCGPNGAPPCRNKSMVHAQSIVASDGHMIKIGYVGSSNFYTPSSIMAMDTSTDYCDPDANSCGTLTQSWPTETVGTSTSGSTTTTTVTNPNSNTTSVDTQSNGVVAVTQPASSGNNTGVTYDGNGRVASVTIGGVTSTYTYVDSGGSRTTTNTEPGSATVVTVTNLLTNLMTSQTDENGNTTSYLYDSSNRMTRKTMPEGNYTQWTYDARGNVTEVRQVAKSGSGLADIVTSASFDTTCSNTLTCNQPNYTIDANGNRTDYTYDATHGGVTKVQLPAATSGQPRPEIDYTYTALYAQTKNASGTLVTSTTPQYKATQITACATAATCSGSANETKITLAYATPTLQLTSKTVAAGDGSVSATETYTYDVFDNLVTVDGPLSGTADTTYYFYDAQHNKIGEIGPDPDGAGSMKRRAIRYTYDVQSRLIRTEHGTANGVTLSDLTGMTVLQQADTTYDTNGNKTLDTVSSSGTTYNVTQYSYDNRDRLECTALRMNSTVWGSLPSSACTLGTTGSSGADRITRNVYDAASRPTQVQTAYATGDQANEATGTYNNNGTLATLTDADGNKTSYVYDGVDRLSQTFYPSTTAGSGTSSTTDYVQLTYDAAGHVTSRRLRDGNSIGYTYDADGQLTYKDLPTGENDVTYAYDLLSRPTSAATSLQTLTFGYDALSRLTSQGGPLGTVSAQYDLADRRTRLTWPDSFYVTYDYLVTGEVSAVRENGAASGIGVLATYAYDDLGRRTSLTRGNSTSSSFSYDNASRLTSLGLDLDGAGTTNDLSLGFGYSPANQIASTTRSNNLYSWGGAADRNDASSVNGLNQTTTVGAGNIGYDSKGNLNSTGSNSYTYSSENLLLTGPSSASLVYDPVLRLYQEAGSTSATFFQYDGQAMIGEYDTLGTMQKRYVMGPGTDEPLVEYDKSGGSYTRTWLHADERGSIIAQSNDSGATTAINSYDEYGVPGGGNVGRLQYTGQAWLPTLGLYYYKARIYSSHLGRFMQTDPIGYGDGVNWYNYVGGDPINYIDPSGFCGAGEVKVIEPSTESTDPDGTVVVTGHFRCAKLLNNNAGGLPHGGDDEGGGPDRPGHFNIPRDKAQFCQFLTRVTRVGTVIGFTGAFNQKGWANAIKLIGAKAAPDITPGIGEVLAAVQIGATAAGAGATALQLIVNCP